MKKGLSILKGSLLLLLGAFLLVGCGNSQTETPAEPTSITVSAAASLKDVMEEIKTDYQSVDKNVDIVYNFGSSGSLQQQIEQGAPADLFMSAAPKQMNALEEKDLIIKDTRVDLLKNRVVLITPTDNNDVTSFEDLKKDSVAKIGMGDPESVPVGTYTMEVLNYFNLFAEIEDKLVYGKDVREVLSWVDTKNTEAGIVYETDAKVADGVKIVATAPEDSHKPVVYPAAVLKSTQNEAVTKAFLDYLKTDAAKAKFEKYGFTTL